MKQEQFQRIEEIFHKICEIPPSERARHLDEHCGSDLEVRNEVERLLAFDGSDRDFTAQADAIGAASAATFDRQRDSEFPETIGRYRILGVCGVGGMGTVYEAEQESPHRRVALKVIRPGTMTPDLLRRFRLEADILGQLQHPSIAQVFEAGTYDVAGVEHPYFAMEFVDGAALNAYVADRNPNLEARLELFALICDAVHYAHQKGIVHRDLKPANVLVTEDTTTTDVAGKRGGGRPKILDFGVARATDADVQVTTMRTAEAAIIGTLRYMSPEQVQGDRSKLDTRSDIYALGVMLFELLSGRVPLELGDSIPAAIASICDDEPTRLGTVRAELRGDVETMVGKCLEKEPDRRYDSAADLASDLRRFLRSEPILARPPSAMYQISRFARRNRVLVGGIATTMVALIAGTVLSTVFAVKSGRHAERASENEKKATLELARATEVKQFLTTMLAAITPLNAETMDTTLLRTILDEAAARIDRDEVTDPEIEAELCGTIGGVYSMIGETDKAEPLHRRTASLYEELYGADHPSTFRARYDLGESLLWAERFRESVDVLVEVHETSKRVLGATHVVTIDAGVALGSALIRLDEIDEAERLFRDVLDQFETDRDDLDPNTHSRALSGLALVHTQRGQTTEAVAARRSIVDTNRELFGEDSLAVVTARYYLAKALIPLDAWEEIESVCRELEGSYRRWYGDHHRRTIDFLATYGRALNHVGKVTEAQAILAEVLEYRRRTLDADDPALLRAVHSMAYFLFTQQKADEAAPLFREAYEGRRRIFGEKHPETMAAAGNLASMLLALGRLSEAEPICLATHDAILERHGDASAQALAATVRMAHIFKTQGKFKDGERYHVEMFDISRRAFGADHGNTQRIIGMVADFYDAWHADEPADGHDETANEWRRKRASG